MTPLQVRPGTPSPLGATWDGRGTNFAVYSEAATGVDLCLFDAEGRENRVPLKQRTEHVWHAYLEGVGPGQVYAYRVDGPWEPKKGLRFNPHVLLLDPYAKAVDGIEDWSRGGFAYDIFHSGEDKDLVRAEKEQGAAPRAVVVDGTFDWGNDARPNTPFRKTIFYETHVKGLTMRHPEVPPEIRGTYAAIASEPILRYLRELGITALELLPVHQFTDDQHLLEKGLRNYWGYNTIGFFAPEVRYRAGDAVGAEVVQFKEMVRALHASGIEVILDVVYNHTAEGNHLGPTLSLKGIDNTTYYRLVPDNPRYYFDYTGTGNSLNVRHPQALRLIMDSLRYWVEEFHVDGFRFDLASTLARSLHEVDRLGGFFTVINQDPVLANVKLIAEPWDLGEGGYQVGRFPVKWAEWNGKYRDSIRAFWRGDGGQAAEIGYRLTGSSDLYGAEGRKPYASINFIAAHDGYTVRDLCTYEKKHNEANGEENRDGHDDNRSWNAGVEGETDDPAVNAVRRRQQRNLLATLLLSQGTPMLSGGDEIGRTQGGNNNAYCQDNEISWYDWELDGERKRLFDFVKKLIRIRHAHPLLQRATFAEGRNIRGLGVGDIEWFRHDGQPMSNEDWTNPGTSSLGLFMSGSGPESIDEEGTRMVDDDLFLLLNASDTDLEFTLPAMVPRAHGLRWELLVDTANDGGREQVSADATTKLGPRSLKLFRRAALTPAGLDAVYGAPVSSYRLQLHAGFRFEDARAITEYLDALGAGGVYASPFLRAEKGSTHGYDVVDHGALNPEIGTREELAAWAGALAQRGMKHVLDFVPNHVGIGSGENARWNDVLAHGAGSVYAEWFDIDWSPPTGALEGKVLLPVLGGQFGEELDGRKLSVARQGGTFWLRYYEHRFPTSPESAPMIIEAAAARVALPPSDPAAQELASILHALRHLPPASPADAGRAERARETEVTARRLAAVCESSKEVAAAVEGALAELNDSPDRLEAFVMAQHYRLAFWRVAGDEINYRRFFDINGLAAIRMEDPKVFAETHRLIFELLGEGQITALRLDHTDGLYDPEAYLASLQDGARQALARRDKPAEAPLYVVAEKILEPGEELPGKWAVSGTTGYDYLAAINGLWVDPAGERIFNDLFATMTGRAADHARIAYEAKRIILRSSVASEVQMLAHSLKRIADGRRRSRDFTLTSLRRVLEETVASFPVYRTYVKPDGSREAIEEERVRRAISAAKRRNPLIDASVFAFLRSILLLEDRAPECVGFAMRFQQFTGPVMAKGVEDTAMYRFPRLLSTCEVGSDPSRFGIAPADFHAHNERALARWPLAMTATTTHDTKRSEDVRARISVLSEMPDEWREAVGHFHGLAKRHIADLDGDPAPSPLDEYVFYQTVVGAWPYEGSIDESFVKRLEAYMLKAAHEAKLETSWVTPNAQYDDALAAFVRGTLGDAAFVDAVRALVEAVLPHGASNSLAQVALRMASPGVPDIYQGTELWDLSLVDPDNRRPVDFALRRQLLGELEKVSPRELVSRYRDGRIKMHVLSTALRFRRSHPALFLEGAYRALEPGSPHVVGFQRAHENLRLTVVVPRFTRRLLGHPGFALGEAWKDLALDLGPGPHENLFTRTPVHGGRLRELLQDLPVAWLLHTS